MAQHDGTKFFVAEEKPRGSGIVIKILAGFGAFCLLLLVLGMSVGGAKPATNKVAAATPLTAAPEAIRPPAPPSEMTEQIEAQRNAEVALQEQRRVDAKAAAEREAAPKHVKEIKPKLDGQVPVLVEIELLSAQIKPVPLKDAMGKSGTSKGDRLCFDLRISNKSNTHKRNYKSWAGAVVSFDVDFATLEDELKNQYKRVDFGFMCKVEGRSEDESLYPGKVATDLLVFEVPVDGARKLDLELPLKNLGGKGTLTYSVPVELIEKP
jgi:hypothetical protein